MRRWAIDGAEPRECAADVRSWRRLDPSWQADWRCRRRSAVRRRRRWRAARNPRCGHVLSSGGRGMAATEETTDLGCRADCSPRPSLPKRRAMYRRDQDVPVEAARHGTIPWGWEAPAPHAPGWRSSFQCACTTSFGRSGCGEYAETQDDRQHLNR